MGNNTSDILAMTKGLDKAGIGEKNEQVRNDLIMKQNKQTNKTKQNIDI